MSISCIDPGVAIPFVSATIDGLPVNFASLILKSTKLLLSVPPN